MQSYHLAPVRTSPIRFRQLALTLHQQFGADAREVAPGHWAFEVKTRKQRSQVVHLLLKQQSAEGHDTSRLVVSSPIGPLPRRCNFEWLMRQNASLDVGALCVEELRDGDNTPVVYLTHRASHLVETAQQADVWEMVHQVAGVADRIEEELFVHDVH